MVTIEFIRKLFYKKGYSIRKIHRETGMSRQSIRKALISAEVPRYKLSAKRPSPVMDPYKPIIQQWLEQDKQAPKKQRHTAKRIFDRLVAEYGFPGAYSTVRRTVREMRNEPEEAFIPQDAGYGEEAQVDFGSAQVVIGGKEVKVTLFCFRLRASGVPFVRAYPTERLECFLDGHVRAFEDLGVPLRCRYDNTRTAVTKILQGPEREEQSLFASLRAHYLFDSEFCNPRRGNEKGSVENLVGYVRRNVLVPVPQLASMDELNRLLAQWCEREKQRLAKEWEPERMALRRPKASFRACISTWAMVNRLCLVNFDRVRYSVPSKLVGRQVRIDAYPERIEIYHEEQRIATHRRAYHRGDSVMDPLHYLDVIKDKKRAAPRAQFVKGMPAVYSQARAELGLRQDGYKEFANILLLAREFPLEQVTAALEKALSIGRPKAAVVRQLILANQPVIAVPVVVPKQLTARVPEPDLERYNQLAKGVSR